MSTALPPTITDSDVTLREAGVITGISAGQYFGYCNVVGVQYEFANIAEMPQILTSPVAAGKSRIAQEIFGAAVELQVELDHFYTMPYTGSSNNILAQLYDLNAKLAASRILKRLFTGAETTVSVAAQQLEQWVTEFYSGIENGKIRWDPPFGDAVPRAMNAVYDLAQVISVAPNPNAADQSAVPMFSITTSSSFDRSRVM